MTRTRTLANYVAFQLAWTATVLAVRGGHAHLAPLAGLASAALCLAWSDAPRRELLVLVAVTALGTALDSLGVALGVLAFPADPSARLGLVPLWIASQWLNFATTLRHSLAWLAPRPLLAALLGALGGPLAYRSSAALGVVELHPDALFAGACLALEWALATPLVLALARGLGGPSPARGTEPRRSGR